MSVPKGYELITEVVEADYSWSAVGLFKQVATGRVYFATDGGCSCNGPWDDLTEGDFTPLTRDNMQEAIEAAKNTHEGPGEITAFIAEIEALLR